MKIKTNDKVKIITGKDAGKSGKVIQIFSDDERVVVEGLNLMKKHIRPRQKSEKGQIIELASPIHVSNVSLICPKCAKETRVACKVEAGSKKRMCKK
ncbi:MAG: 50S ribosomal protein L24, partial [Patescibacteria group bacterium]